MDKKLAIIEELKQIERSLISNLSLLGRTLLNLDEEVDNSGAKEEFEKGISQYAETLNVIKKNCN